MSDSFDWLFANISLLYMIGWLCNSSDWLFADTSFMYMIGWLCMLKIYQIRHPDINPQAHIAFFCAAFVIFIAVIGVVSICSLATSKTKVTPP